jgi:hypothetical protein
VNFSRVLKEVLWCLVAEGRISYRRIKLSLGLDDDALEALCRELIGIKQVAADIDGELLVWAPAGRPARASPCVARPIIRTAPSIRRSSILNALPGGSRKTTAARLAKLESALAPYRLPREEAVPLFASLLSVPLDDASPRLDLTPEQLKEHTADTIVALTLVEAERRPLLEVWEDVHWADPSTLDLLGQLIDQAPTVPLLIVLTYRPEFAPSWPARSHVRPLTLNRLERPQTEVMATRLAGGRALPAEVVEHIVQKTDGVPLFVEVMTKAVQGSAVLRAEGDHYALTGPLSEISIPASLHESLMARLDRLLTLREVAQLGAVLGRDFAYEMLRAITSLEEPRLRDVLGRLVEAELLYQRGRPPRSRYIFKHALIQDTAYQSLCRARGSNITAGSPNCSSATSPTPSRSARSWWRTTTARPACRRRRSPIGSVPVRTRQGARRIWKRSAI